MRVDSISNNSFEGKVKIDKKLSKPMIEYAERILDFPYSGTTARERIQNATFDVRIYGRVSKKTVKPRLHFSSECNLLRGKKQLTSVDKTIFCSNVRGTDISCTVAKGAYDLNKFITDFNQYKKQHKNSFNSFGEKLFAYFNNMFSSDK